MPDFDPSTLLPSGPVVDAVGAGPDLISITAHPAQEFGIRPTCGRRSDRNHSLHRRWLLDLPSHGWSVELLCSAELQLRGEAPRCLSIEIFRRHA
jgi:hypothetical protein